MLYLLVIQHYPLGYSRDLVPYKPTKGMFSSSLRDYRRPRNRDLRGSSVATYYRSSTQEDAIITIHNVPSAQYIAHRNACVAPLQLAISAGFFQANYSPKGNLVVVILFNSPCWAGGWAGRLGLLLCNVTWRGGRCLFLAVIT